MYEFLIGGCSGSNTPAFARPIHGHLTTSYGLLDRENKKGIVIDNGTGIQLVAKEMLAAGVEQTWILQTHFHSDHLEGLQLNALLFGKTIQGIIAPVFDRLKQFPDIFAERFHFSAWPVSPELFGIKPKFQTFDVATQRQLRLGDLHVHTFNLNHPGGAVAYQFDVAGGIVIATDNELKPSLQTDYASFVSDATLLIADVQYTQREYDGNIALGGKAISRKNWGHSTPEMLAETLARCHKSPKEVWLTHHDPSRTDEELLAFEQKANISLPCKLAVPTLD